MIKHIHHIPHYIESLMHTFVFMAAIFKHNKHKEEGYLGDNFPFRNN